MEDLFPYRFRSGQAELIEWIRKNLWSGEILVQAATGWGKTPSVLTALLPYSNRYTILWAVRTGAETDRPIEELKFINQRKGTNFFGISFRGKHDMCLLAREVKEQLTHEDVTYMCERYRDECEFHQRVRWFNPMDLVSRGPLLYSELLDLCSDMRVCPYEAQRQLISYANVVGLNYNYIISEPMGWAIRSSVPFNKCLLVVDEAHNLPQVCSDLNSDQISLETLTRALGELERFQGAVAERMDELIRWLKAKLERLASKVEEESEFDPIGFLRSVYRSDSEPLREFFAQMKRFGERVRYERLVAGEVPRSSLKHLGDFWLRALEPVDGVVFIAKRENERFWIERYDMRSAELLRPRWEEFANRCVFCSGTLTPFDQFVEKVGVGVHSEIQIPAHYSTDSLVLCLQGITTKGEELDPERANQYVESIELFLDGIRANSIVFSASYRIQEELIRAGLKRRATELGYRFFEEKKSLTGDEARRMLDRFKRCPQKGKPGVLCGSAGGRFAEGVDFPGRELEGIFLVGVPFDRLTVRTKLVIDYHKRVYGADKGWYYGYLVPALRKANQALGRMLRSETDRGVFVLGDERYSEQRLVKLLPDWISSAMRSVDRSDLANEIRQWKNTHTDAF